MSNRNGSNDGERAHRETENRVENLIDIVEKKTRTERHLEQYSHIGDPERLERPRELQMEREEEIENLKDKIVHGDGGSSDEVKNLKKNYEFANGYIEHNADHMNPRDLENLKNRQEHRKDQMDFLD